MDIDLRRSIARIKRPPRSVQQRDASRDFDKRPFRVPPGLIKINENSLLLKSRYWTVSPYNIIF